MRNRLSFKEFRPSWDLVPAIAIVLLIVATMTVATSPAQAAGCDINGDGLVNLSDVALFASIYTSGVYDPRGDLNGDGVINLADLSIFAACF